MFVSNNFTICFSTWIPAFLDLENYFRLNSMSRRLSTKHVIISIVIFSCSHFVEFIQILSGHGLVKKNFTPCSPCLTCPPEDLLIAFHSFELRLANPLLIYRRFSSLLSVQPIQTPVISADLFVYLFLCLPGHFLPPPLDDDLSNSLDSVCLALTRSHNEKKERERERGESWLLIVLRHL